MIEGKTQSGDPLHCTTHSQCTERILENTLKREQKVLTRNSTKKIEKIREVSNFFMGFEPITLKFQRFLCLKQYNTIKNSKQKQKITKWSEKQNRIKIMMRKTVGVDKYLWPEFDAIHDFPFIQFLVLLSFFFFNILKRFSSIDLKGN